MAGSSESRNRAGVVVRNIVIADVLGEVLAAGVEHTSAQETEVIIVFTTLLGLVSGLLTSGTLKVK